MSERTSSKPGIADYVVARRKRTECFLDEIDRLIDWNPLEKLLRKTLKRVVNAVGNPAYPPLPMFKILLLQRWYNLSDTAVEEALYDRYSLSLHYLARLVQRNLFQCCNILDLVKPQRKRVKSNDPRQLLLLA